jgi:hypothetical protein
MTTDIPSLGPTPIKTHREFMAKVHEAESTTLPEYTGTTDSDRAEYLRANSHELATEAVTSARQQRANQLITDPDSVMDAARPERNDATSKENAKRVGQEILGARHVHEFLSDSEGSFEGISPGCLMTDNRLAELQSFSNQLASVSTDFEAELENRFCETIPEAAAFLSDMQRADEMAATREERVGAAVDEAWPTEEDLDEVDRMQAEYYEKPVEEV